MTACLGDETIAAMLEGALSAEHARHARDHLATCDACRRLVSAAIDAPSDDAPPPSAPLTERDAVVPGAVIDGKYRIERALGEGGMGRVMAARQIGLERPVAIKVLRSELARNPDALRRFKREARLVAQLASESVVRVHDLGELPTGEPYLVMELLEGEDLDTMLARGPLPLDRAISYVVSACEGLAEAHALGMMHRDIKPSNLFLTKTGRLVLLDFGLAKLVQPRNMAASTQMTATGQLMGSPRYMSPEQIVGSANIDYRADIWSIGATLYHCVTGIPAFPQTDLTTLFTAILEGWRPSLEGIRPDVASVIARCLAKDPNARFQDVREIVRILTSPPRAYSGPPPAAPTVPVPAKELPSPVVWPWILGAVLLLGGVGGGIAAIAHFARGPSILPSPPVSTGRVPPLDDARLKARLKRAGWSVISTQLLPQATCDTTVMSIGNDAGGGWTVAYEDCWSASTAASEERRLMKPYPESVTIRDGGRLVWVALKTEQESRALAEALVAP